MNSNEFKIEYLNKDADLDCQDGTYDGGLIRRDLIKAISMEEALEKAAENVPPKTKIVIVWK
jgi:hypothetical protein